MINDAEGEDAVLDSVSKFKEHGGGCIIPSDAEELPMIRQLISQINHCIRLKRDKGIYQMKNWMMDAPFAGQGR